MIYLWGYIVVGAVIGALALYGLRLAERHGHGDPRARAVVDQMGAPAVVAAIVLFWPVLCWIVWGKKR